MRFFRYAEDYYGNWLPVQLLPAAAILMVIVVIAFAGIHLFRRGFGEPISHEPHDAGWIGEKKVQKYEFGARLYHWGNALFLLGLAVTGIALFVPGSLKPFRLSWLLLHEIFAGLYIVGLVFHAIVAPIHGEGRTMWFGARDLRDLFQIWGNFFGLTKKYPRFGKYDPLQKLYHALLTLVSAFMIFSGVYLFLNAEIFANFRHEWMRWQRLIHDLGAFVLIAVVVGHIYFGIIRVNWPNLAAIITGKITARYYRLRHSAERWPPEVQEPGAESREPGKEEPVAEAGD